MKSKSRAIKRVLFSRKATTKGFTYRGTKKGGRVVYGLGHRAGEEWGDKKDINPDSLTRKYSKNSPSFDEGVKLSKAKRKALESLK